MGKARCGVILGLVAATTILAPSNAAAHHCQNDEIHLPVLGSCANKPVDPEESALLVNLDPGWLLEATWRLLRFGDS